MDVQNGVYRFEQVARNLPPRLRDLLLALPDRAKYTTLEIRLRVDKPIALTYPNQTWFVDINAQLHNIPRACFPVTPQEIEEAVLAISSYSVHTHQNEMKNGYITLRGGHRAGVCGQAVLSGGKISALREITSLNLRIAREIAGAADRVLEAAFAEGLKGVLIAGPPASGKTTILRDLARQLSNGGAGGYHKVAVVDERGEIGAVYQGLPQNDLGPCCDILSGYPKGEGILMAVRTLSPHLIICDEIGGEEDVTGMLDGLRCGVCLVASAHADSLEELLGRRQITRLLREGAFSTIILLGGPQEPGKVIQTIPTEDLHCENGRYYADCPLLLDDGDAGGFRFVGAPSQA